MACLKTAWIAAVSSPSTAILFQPRIAFHIDWRSGLKGDAAHSALLNYGLHHFDRWYQMQERYKSLGW